MPAALTAAVAAIGTSVGGAVGATLIMNAGAIASSALLLGAVGANTALSHREQRKAKRASHSPGKRGAR